MQGGVPDQRVKVKRVDPGVGPPTLPIAMPSFASLGLDELEEPIEKRKGQQNVPIVKRDRGRPRKVLAVVS